MSESYDDGWRTPATDPRPTAGADDDSNAADDDDEYVCRDYTTVGFFGCILPFGHDAVHGSVPMARNASAARRGGGIGGDHECASSSAKQRRRPPRRRGGAPLRR